MNSEKLLAHTYNYYHNICKIKGNESYFGIKEIVDSVLPESAVLAGGGASALFTNGGHPLRDLDIFFVCVPEKVLSEIDLAKKKLKLLFKSYELVCETCNYIEVQVKKLTFQFIKKPHKKIKDIILDFDISASQIAYKKGFIFTESYYEAIKTGTIHFNLNKLAFSSARRYAKYKSIFRIATNLKNGRYFVKNRGEKFYVKDKEIIEIYWSGYDEEYDLNNYGSNILNALTENFKRFKIVPDQSATISELQRYKICKILQKFSENPEKEFSEEIEKALETAADAVENYVQTKDSSFTRFIPASEYFENF